MTLFNIIVRGFMGSLLAMGTENTEPASPQWCPLTGKMSMGTN